MRTEAAVMKAPHPRYAAMAREMQAAALGYAAKGIPVFPCRSDKRPYVGRDRDAEGKPIPRTGGLYKASTDEEQVREWWARWPLAMIGMNGGDAGADDARGASSVVNAARTVRLLNRMSEGIADDYGIANPRAYFRAYSDKCNLAPPADVSEWYRLEDVLLPNNEQVGVAVRWQPPKATDDITVDDLKAAQRKVAGGQWRESPLSPEWVGYPIAEALELDITDPEKRQKVKKLIGIWTANGMFRVVEKADHQRKVRKFVEVAEWA